MKLNGVLRIFFNTNIILPKGYICLFLNGRDVYKYIDEDEDLNSYAPNESDIEDDFDKTIISKTYKQLQSLKTQPAINEMFKRLNLFENVSKLLKRILESIIDESLEYLDGKADILPQTIIKYIQTIIEGEELAILTSFYTISQNPYFLSERSIREFCGLNMQEEELSSVLRISLCNIIRSNL